MPTIAQIDSEIARLQSERTTLLAAEQTERRAAIAAVSIKWDWRINWLNGHTARIEKRWSDATIAAMDAIGATPNSFSDWREFRGMNYTLTCDNHLCAFGGGHVVLNVRDDWPAHNGRLLTDTQIASLRNGIVPAELRQP